MGILPKGSRSFLVGAPAAGHGCAAKWFGDGHGSALGRVGSWSTWAGYSWGEPRLQLRKGPHPQAGPLRQQGQ